MHNLSILHKLIAVGLCAIITACGSETGNSEEANSPDQKTESYETEAAETYNETDDFSFILPSPLQIASIFKRSGLTFQSGITNPTDNVTNYTSKLAKQLNFGVYSADMSYAVLNKQAQEARTYMKAVKRLSDELGMSTIFTSESLFESFDRNIGNEDSTIYILATIQEQMDEYLEENDQQYLSAIYFAGAWVEGMYIGTIVSETKKDKKIGKRLVEQITILENLTKGLAMTPDQTPDMEKLIADLTAVHDIFLSFEAIKKAGDQEIKFDELNISDQELEMLSSKIKEIRNSIVNG